MKNKILNREIVKYREHFKTTSLKKRMKESLKVFFVRDVRFRLNAVRYIILSSLGFLILAGTIIVHTWILPSELNQQYLSIGSSVFALIIAMLVLDGIKNKTKLNEFLLFLGAISLILFNIGLFLNFLIDSGYMFKDLELLAYLFDASGRSIGLFSFILGGINLICFLIHESNLLDRARVGAYLFLIICLILFIEIPLMFSFLSAIPLIIEIFFIIYYLKKKGNYTYEESVIMEESLFHDVSFKSFLRIRESLGYFLAFVLITFILGLDFVRYNLQFNFFIVYFIFLSFLPLAGAQIDNMGRKRVLLGAVFILSIFTIFSNEITSFLPLFQTILLILFALSLNYILILFITYSGDITRDEYKKYRAMIISLYVFGVLIGFFLGYITANYIMDIYSLDPVRNAAIPEYINKIGAFALICLMLVISPLKETLQPKEVNWFVKLRRLYVFNKSGICLFSHNFTIDIKKTLKSKDPLFKIDIETPTGRDLASSGLSGIINLISEIIDSDKKLKELDHEDRKILFNYGEHAIFCLICSQKLNILNTKLKEFSQDFESTYKHALIRFRGDLSAFDDASYLIEKHFHPHFFTEEM